MIDQELKKKIVNTISRYELKCDHLQLEINTLKNALHQLIINPLGVHYEVDDHLKQFRQQLDCEFDPIELENKINHLAELFANLQKKKHENSRMTTSLIRQGVDSIARLTNKSQDKRAIKKLEKLFDTELESQTLLMQFNEVLSQCVSSVTTEIEELNKLKNTTKQVVESESDDISLKVNDSLQQLMNHLSIPRDLDSKREEIKSILENKLSGDTLSKVIDGLTELVVDAFNVEQNRFKGFLQQLTNQLQDFDIFLKSTSDTRKVSANESMLLENGIQDNINQIRNHLDNSKTIEELSTKVSQNLEVIGARIKEFRENEKKRAKEHEEQVKSLQAKLSESEQNADEIMSLLSFQKYRINHDSLTGLPNRECYDEQILDAYQRWKRHNNDLSLAVCDIDHFKHINDTYGHLAGDKVLKKVALILKSSIRTIDFVARMGGEEFVLIFENTASSDAQNILEKLRTQVKDCQFFYREHKVDVTVSFGLTSIKENDDIESFFIRADNAMYKAKNDGRNRVEVL